MADQLCLFLPVEHRSCNKGGYPPPPTLKRILKFFAKLFGRKLQEHLGKHYFYMMYAMGLY